MTRIARVHVDTLWLPMSEPYVIATSALAANPCALITLETDDGLVGYGEAMPGYEFTGETLWSVEDVIEEYLGPALIGRDPFDLEAIVHHWEAGLATVGNQAARAGLEMAVWDLQGKALGRPLCELIGGAAPAVVPQIHSFGWADPQDLAVAARRLHEDGVSVFKIKVGDALEKDEARVAAVRDAVGPAAQIKCDANTGWHTPRRAVAAIRLLEPYGVEFVEEPIRMDDLEGCRWVRERVDVPIALDESVRGPREALAAVKAGACDIINVKLMKCGGVLNALKVNAIAEAAGVALHVGSMCEAAMGLAAIIHVHSALANARYSDSYLPEMMHYSYHLAPAPDRDVVDGVAVLRAHEGSGLGLEPDGEVVDALRARRPWAVAATQATAWKETP
jgi:L-alanine-DL-glutamate epimerase-like enolase superfamily enzyme